MFGTEIIEVGIGLAFSYFVISIICSGIVELGVKLTKLRSKHMKMALGKLLDDPHYNGFVAELYNHHLIASPLKDKLGDPTSISAKNFAAAVLEILGKNDKISEREQFKLIEARINTIKDKATKDRLLAILKSSAKNFDTLRAKIENWFNESMESVTEWYRQRMRFWVTLVSVVVVTIMNADTIKMATMFWNDDELRTATVQAAQSYTDNMKERMAAQSRAAAEAAAAAANAPKDSADSAAAAMQPQAPATSLDSAAQAKADSLKTLEDLRALKSNLDNLYSDINAAKVLPIGWSAELLPSCEALGFKRWLGWWLMKLAGILLTIGAVSLGSTYWYKQLQSLLRLRFGKNQQESSPAPDPVPPTTSGQSDSQAGDGEEQPPFNEGVDAADSASNTPDTEVANNNPPTDGGTEDSSHEGENVDNPPGSDPKN